MANSPHLVRLVSWLLNGNTSTKLARHETLEYVRKADEDSVHRWSGYGSPAVSEQLAKAGMNVARLNLSHGTYKEHARYVQIVRKLSYRLVVPLLCS